MRNWWDRNWMWLSTVGVFVCWLLLPPIPPVGAQLTGSDWCQGKDPAKQTVTISITTSGAGEHELVAAVANKAIQVCAFNYSLGGTTPTAEFDNGTKVSTACDTSPTPMTAAMSQTPNSMSGPLDYFTSPAGTELCINLGGSSPTALGFLTYVQK